MKHLKQFFIHAINEIPSPMGNFLAGVFQVLLGTWLLLPTDSFGPVLFAEPGSIFHALEEHQFGSLILLLGILEMVFSIFHKWDWLRHESLFATMFWAFVTVGYILALPTSTNVIIFGFFTIFTAYKYFLLCTYCRNLRNKEKVGTI